MENYYRQANAAGREISGGVSDGNIGEILPSDAFNCRVTRALVRGVRAYGAWLVEQARVWSDALEVTRGK